MKYLLRYGLGIWMAAVIILTGFWLKSASGFNGDSRIMVFHVPSAIASALFFLAGGFYALRYLRHRSIEDDIKSAVSLEIGLVFGALATITGSIFAYYEWHSAWNWDPRETTMIVQLLIYLAYFALRGVVGDPPTRARLSAVFALYALATVPFLFFAMPRLLESLHPSDTLWHREGLDWRYRTVMYSALIGYIWFGIRAFQLHISALIHINNTEANNDGSVDDNRSYSVVRTFPLSSEDRNQDK